jgi:hypothetical protein
METIGCVAEITGRCMGTIGGVAEIAGRRTEMLELFTPRADCNRSTCPCLELIYSVTTPTGGDGRVAYRDIYEEL